MAETLSLSPYTVGSPWVTQVAMGAVGQQKWLRTRHWGAAVHGGLASATQRDSSAHPGEAPGTGPHSWTTVGERQLPRALLQGPGTG